MIRNKIPIKGLREKLGRKTKIASEEIKSKIPLYIEFLKTLAGIGKNLSLDVDNGCIKIKEELINDYLKDIPLEDKGLRSIRISCNDSGASFFVEIKKFLFDGIIEIPFTVEEFLFNKDKKVITIRFSDKKMNKARNYYSKIAFWFMVSILNIFVKQGDRLSDCLAYPDSVVSNRDGTYTIDLNKITELKDLFNKGMINMKYWDLVSLDKLRFQEGVAALRISHERSKVMKVTLVLIEILPVGRLIRPLLNRF
ncbi:MAG: hypothetical protein D8M57_03995 [Candidatus Scalindua sp. AMX11]|nr:MAG: hypothetical protein DWQ00_10700 [Candidatus Scalindua sp.]NOG82673.1 hypothetical protein [Planctomycetota bacterium]RZV95247.1 MAG: hypothetical protein EX341_02640 [Candidatus Scalindua sp. SCAELEC01]TDE66273.1 MAG: hypothetical protein D8M57_03995 [Candidatus Scalindua sp. AMX11]GJQ57896.1 MAG: hypothetical protein SCALA701_06970 [Candidatus Scalindua sp.]